MSDRSRESSDPPHIDADAVARKTFSSSFRGYDTDEVRAFLLALSEEVRAVNEHTSWLHVQLVAAEERATAHVELDEDRLTALLGEETTRVLASAREAAAAIRSRAESDAERVLSQASEQATAMRSDAMAEAIRHRERAETAAMAEVEAAKAHGRQLITDAQALRERVLADLSRRRNAGRAQIEQLREGRDRLLGAYEVVQRTIDHAVEQLRIAAPDAHAVTAPERVALPAAPDIEEPEGVRVLTPPAPPEPDVAPESQSESEAAAEPDAVVEQIVVEEIVVEEIVVDGVVVDGVVVDGVVVDEVVEVLVVETVVDDVTEETPVLPGDPTLDESVDELFARIRAGRAEEVANAEDILATSHGTLGAEETPTEQAEEQAGEVDAGGEDPGPDVFDQRTAALAPLETSLARKLRRVLADEQNEVLDRLRQGSKLPALDELVGGAAEHGARYGEPARGDLAGAARAGAELIDGVSEAEPADLDDVVTDLGAAVSGPLRERLSACLTDSAGDVDEATELVRSAYREWKTQRIDAVASDALLAGFNRGAFASAPADCMLRWLVAPDQPPCPDADDNALAGEVARGTAFPTGHVHAPAHPGCRCQVVITPR
jgi:DivIVA domain-containing protein